MSEYPIRFVSLRTGLSVHVLRAWENRYAAVRPLRNASGQWRYSTEQLLRLELLATARAAGHSIGSIAMLPLAELKELSSKQTGISTVDKAVSYLALLDAVLLDQELQRALKAFGRLDFIDGFVFPFVSGVKLAIADGRLAQVHLSFAQARLRDLLALVDASGKRSENAPNLVIGSPAGFEHEPGQLGSAIHATSAGWRPVRFSPGTPAEELAFAAVSMKAKAVVYCILLTAKAAGAMVQAVAEAILVRRLTPAFIPVFFGGRIDRESSQTLSDAGLQYVGSMNSLRTRLGELLT